MATPYSAEQLEQLLLERIEDTEFMTVSSVGPLDEAAAEMAVLEHDRQTLLLDWIARVGAVQQQIAYEFARRAPRALQLMGPEGLAAWTGRIMDLYDKVGLYPAMQLLRDMERHAERYREGRSELELESVRGVLEGFLGGLAGRLLRLAPGEGTFTDGDVVYLPASVYAFRDEQDNFGLYKAIVAHHWAQVRFGTLRLDLKSASERFEEPERALEVLNALERLRLDACIARELPGLGREMERLRRTLDQHRLPGPWRGFAEHLQRPGAGSEASLELLAEAYHSEPPRTDYQGAFRPDEVERARARREQRERPAVRRLLAELADEIERSRPRSERERRTRSEPSRFRAETNAESLELRLFLNEEPVSPPVELEKLLGSALIDFGEIPPEWLEPAGPGEYARGERGDAAEDAGRAGESASFCYPEWDYKRRNYRKGWCSVRELPVTAGDDGFVARTRDKYLPLIKQLKRSFEALRGQDKRLRRQPHGDEVDIDEMVDAYADAASGLEMRQNLFTRVHRVERDIAVLFMVDMSGSTKGWINEAEREALILLCEALESLGDRYGIYGFSGMTRIRCEVYPIKSFDEPYGPEVRGRISAIAPRDYTRMGAAIRHLSAILSQVDARTRLLVTLSDGKPDDFDAYYRGDYGIEDTRQALLEARRAGIHPFCITIDSEGPEYLPHMYGHVNYAVVDEVRRLPLKVADIYRRLTA